MARELLQQGQTMSSVGEIKSVGRSYREACFHVITEEVAFEE